MGQTMKREGEKMTLRGLCFEEGATIEQLDDWLNWLRGQERIEHWRNNLESAALLRRNKIRTYLGLRKARLINRHSDPKFDGVYTKSGIPCRRLVI